MTTRTSAVLKANWDERDPAEQFDDLVDTIHNPQSSVDFDGAVTLSSTVAIQGNLTISNTMDILPATAGGSDLGSTSAEWGSVYVSDSKGLYLGADQDASIVQDGSTGVDISIADNDADALDIQQGTNKYLTFNTGNNVERVEVGKPIELQRGQDHSYYWELFDDFNYQAGFTEADKPWVLNSGASGTAVDPAVAAQEGGVIVLTTGDDTGTTAQDGSQLTGYTPVQADSGGLFFETRLHINTSLANLRVNAGLTDTTALEEPYVCPGTAYAAAANDAVAFLYDAAATASGSWHAVAVDSTVEDTTNDPVASGPTIDTWQKLRIEVSVGGGTCTFFVDDVLVGTRTGGGVTPNVNLYPTVIACGDGTASRTVDIDYIHAGHIR